MRNLDGARDRAMAAVSWPGHAPQSIVIPVGVVAANYRAAGPSRAALQLAAWGVVPIGSAIARRFKR
jgi:hypothetical protein